MSKQSRRQCPRRVLLVQTIDGRFVVVLANVVVRVINAGSSWSTAAHFDFLSGFLRATSAMGVGEI